MQRIMGLDVGSKTVGVAISDLLGFTAQGLDTIKINENTGDFGIERLSEIVDTYQVGSCVIGLPKNMDGSEGDRAEKSRAYGQMIVDQLDLPVIFTDERLTTQQAERMLIEEADVSRRKRQTVIDKLAAVLILQSYLDSHY